MDMFKSVPPWKTLRILCYRLLIYSNGLEFAFYLSHRNHCYCWADRWSILNRLQFIRRKEEHYTPTYLGNMPSPVPPASEAFLLYFSQWDSILFQCSFHNCFGLCLKSTETLIWRSEVFILLIPLVLATQEICFFLYFFSKRIQSQLPTKRRQLKNGSVLVG